MRLSSSPIAAALCFVLALFATGAGARFEVSPRGHTGEGRGHLDIRAQLPAHQVYRCHEGECHIVCKKGFKMAHGTCVEAIQARGSPCTTTSKPNSTTSKTSSTTSKTTSSSTKTSSSSSSTPTNPGQSTVDAWLNAQGIWQFRGNNSGIGSWFHTNLGSDSTNGHSWCGYPYNDNTPGFAPDINAMMKDYGWSRPRAGKAYCGLEAKVWATVNGKTVSTTLYITDAFSHQWVRTPDSIDIIYNPFNSKLWAPLHGGSWTSNKNDVLNPVQWKFTGKRNDQYAYKP